VDVPLQALLGDEYTVKRRSLLDMSRASLAHVPGDPRRMQPRLPPKEAVRWSSWGYGTVHVAAADNEGNLVAVTPSGGWIMGNEVAPETGFAPTTRIQTFYLDERHPNRPEPGKRPRTTLTPSLAFRDGKPWMAFGTMGGDQQDQWLSQFFLNATVFGMGLQQAIEAPKATCDHAPGTFYPHEAWPGRVRLEGRIPKTTQDALVQRGHKALADPDWSAGFICAAARTPAGLLQAGADPRGNLCCVFPSAALAW
jgi:gamma-glutamyltranspeptidase/glutathione hydrolase